MTEVKENQGVTNDKGFKNWLKRNKENIIIVGTVVVGVLAGVLLYKKRGTIENSILHNGLKKRVVYKTMKSAVNYSSASMNSTIGGITEKPPVAESTVTTVSETVVEKTTSIINDGKPYSVKGFQRTLPEGWKASPKKIAEALELGIELGPNQTYVDPCIKNKAA